VANLINPVQRSAGSASGGGSSGAVSSGAGIPYTGKKANASIPQVGYFSGIAQTGPGGDTLGVANVTRRLGTLFFVPLMMQVDTITANIGASNSGRMVGATLYRDASIVQQRTFFVPMLALTNASPQVARFGGLVGPIDYVDEASVSGQAVYSIVVDLGVFTQIDVSALWQEIRR
jgi:hypothetical protein